MTVPTAAPPRSRTRRLLLLGPAFVAAVAYVDPGNFATNVEGGMRHGFLLVWVLVAANLVAMLLQYLAAKAGAVTGKSLPELCRERYPRPVVWGLWLQAEAVVVMTDLAEVLGGAIALNLLFDVPLPLGGLAVAAVSIVLLAVRDGGQRRFEAVVVSLLAVVGGVFLYQVLLSGVAVGEAAAGLVPRFDGTDSVLLAAGTVGATVMPHAVYVHSALTRDRFAPKPPSLPRLLRAQRTDVALALGAAGAVNLAMLVAAATTLRGERASPSLEGAYEAFAATAGSSAAVLFAVALLASGLASAGVGVYAGDIVMRGFLRRSVPLALRRCVTVLPALVVLAIGVDPTSALLFSQITLSLGIPFALIPLVALTRRTDVMGEAVNRRGTTVAAVAASGAVIALNVALLALAARG
ncbi:Nramp family divalent metal transporter [Streptomyces viridiviolaceus]